MEAIILAGGLGTRLKHYLPSTVPKPMANITGKPFLEILLSSLATKGFQKVIISLGHMADKIINHFGNSFQGMTIVYVIEEEPLGTGGAIKLAIEQVQQDHVYIMNGDSFIDLDFQKTEREWRKYKLPIIIGVEVNDRSRYGSILYEGSFVKSFLEKGLGGKGVINSGCYVLERFFFDGFQSHKFSFEDWLIKNVSKKRFRIFISVDRFIDIGIPEDYLRADIFFNI